MTYAEFKAFLATFLWKDNDAVLVANLDSLIKMANAELNRTLDIERREVVDVINPTSWNWSLPADFRHMIEFNDSSVTNGGQWSKASVGIVLQARSRQVTRPLYAVNGLMLYLTNNHSVLNPGEYTIRYRANVPNFAVTDVSYLADEMLDLYTYTALSHSATFLREDERLATWNTLKTDALATAIREDKSKVAFGASPLHVQPHSLIPYTTRR